MITEHMSQTIHDFRNLFKSEKKIEEFKLINMIKNILTFMDEILINITIHIEINKPIYLKSHQNELSQVILTILQNSVEAFEVKKDMEEYLNAYFKTLYSALDGEQALELYYQYHPDVLLLDIGIPKINGLDLAKEIRQHDDKVKIIMLTAYSDTKRLLETTELKLTKYLLKPFSPKQFKDTLKLLLKELQKSDSNFLNFGDGYIWNKTNEHLTLKGTPLKLSEKEHNLLKFLLSKKEKTVTYEDIMVEVWENSFEEDISLDSVKNLVSRLRKKLPKNFIKSIYKEGYKINKF